MNCAKYLQKCAREPLRANRCPACNALELCPADCSRRLYFATSPYPHLELSNKSTGYFIPCGFPVSRWYRPELLVGLARAVPPAMSSSATPGYRAACAVHAAALPHAASPALPAPPAATQTSALPEPGPTRCVRQLTWMPSVIVVEPDSAEQVITSALSPAAAGRSEGSQTPLPSSAPHVAAVPRHPETTAAKAQIEVGIPPQQMAANPGGSLGVQAPGAGPATADSDGPAMLGAFRSVANVMVVRRDTRNVEPTQKLRKEPNSSAPRLPAPGYRPAHTRAVALLDGSRCVVIVDTGADVSLVSARVLRPDARYLPWSERHGRITAVAQQGVAILSHVVLEVQLGPVRALTSFVVALGVGFDAILGVDFLYEHGISVNLAQHCLVFEEHESLVVPLVGHHPRFKHACAITHDVWLCLGERHWCGALARDEEE